MKKCRETKTTTKNSAYKQYEKQLAVENGYKTYLSYCVKEGCLDPEEANEILEKKDWGRVEYMMSYGDYVADLAKAERGDV